MHHLGQSVPSTSTGTGPARVGTGLWICCRHISNVFFAIFYLCQILFLQELVRKPRFSRNSDNILGKNGLNQRSAESEILRHVVVHRQDATKARFAGQLCWVQGKYIFENARCDLTIGRERFPLDSWLQTASPWLVVSGDSALCWVLITTSHCGHVSPLVSHEQQAKAALDSFLMHLPKASS